MYCTCMIYHILNTQGKTKNKTEKNSTPVHAWHKVEFGDRLVILPVTRVFTFTLMDIRISPSLKPEA
jgi:hypothetical protein